MDPHWLETWLERQTQRLEPAPMLATGPEGRRVTLMNLVLRDDYGLAHKRSVAFQLEADSTGQPVLTFDSHTNAFPEAFYHRLGLIEVRFRASLQAGHWQLRLLRRGPLGEVELASVSGEDWGQVDLPVTLAAEDTRLVVQIAATPDLQLGGAAWCAAFEGEAPVLGVSITTYNKEDYLRVNLRRIAASRPAREGLLSVMVVNNGAPITDPGPEVTLLTRDNIGGTGGFRTAFDRFKSMGLRHFLIMDDDILIAPDLLERVWAISCFARGLHVGTLAEILNTPERHIKEQGANIRPDDVLALDLHNADLRLDSPQRAALYRPVEVDYNGWWGLLVDLQAAGPLPPEWFFIRRDDIGFGLESRAAGCPTLAFPNLHVTHSEIGAPLYFYFDIRNELVMRLRADPPLPMPNLRGLAQAALIALQTDRQKMINRALQDVMKGPEALAGLNPAILLPALKAIVARPVPIPPEAEILPPAVPRRGSARDFLRPSAYRGANVPPVITGDPCYQLGGRCAYYEPLPRTETAFLRRRRLSGLWHYARTLLLLRRFLRRQAALARAYRPD